MLLNEMYIFSRIPMRVSVEFQVFKKLTTFLKSLGVKAVFDVSSSRDIALVETCNEFIARYKQSQASDDEKSKTSLPMLSSACPGIYFKHFLIITIIVSLYTYALHVCYTNIEISLVKFRLGLYRHFCLILGWICYAEKQLGSYVLPYISSVKSPQQTVGATIKHHTCHKLGFRYAYIAY